MNENKIIIPAAMLILLCFVFFLFTPSKRVVRGNNDSLSEQNSSQNLVGRQRTTTKNRQNKQLTKSRHSLITRQVLEPVKSYKRQGNYDEAIVELQKIVTTPGIADVDTVAESMYELARIYMIKKDFKAATEMFKKFLAAHPTHGQKENAQRALEFINNYDTFRREYISFEDDIK
jgi:tetratricopeptide (TPR) repeat protein